MGSATRLDACWVGFEDGDISDDTVSGSDRNDSQQLGGRGPFPATYTRADRELSPVRQARRTRATYHSESLPRRRGWGSARLDSVIANSGQHLGVRADID